MSEHQVKQIGWFSGPIFACSCGATQMDQPEALSHLQESANVSGQPGDTLLIDGTPFSKEWIDERLAARGEAKPETESEALRRISRETVREDIEDFCAASRLNQVRPKAEGESDADISEQDVRKAFRLFMKEAEFPYSASAMREVLIQDRARRGAAASDAGGDAASFQSRVQPWMMACFGKEIAGDREERNHRFLEEALELVQSCGCSASEAHQLVDYVFGREVGEPAQEAGGVMVTLAALCLANGLNMHEAAEVELARIWTKVEKIRAKQAAKPKHSPVPAAPQPTAPAAITDEVVAWQRLSPTGSSTGVTDTKYYKDIWERDGSIVRPLYASPQPTASTDEMVERVARAIYETDPIEESGETVDGFQITPTVVISWDRLLEYDEGLYTNALEKARAAIQAARIVPTNAVEEIFREALSRISKATPGNTNTGTSWQALSWCRAVADSALAHADEILAILKAGGAA